MISKSIPKMTMDIEKQLIYEVRNHPLLYDSADPSYNDKRMKFEVWKTISQRLMSGDDLENNISALKTRWKSLRDSYVKDQRYDIARSNGIALKYKKPWRLKKHMDFLAPFVLAKREKRLEKRGSMSVSSVNRPNYVILHNNPSTSESCHNKVKDEFSQTAPIINQGPMEMDSFFKGISDCVKGLNRRNQMIVQQEVTKIVMEYKLREIEEENRGMRRQL